MKKIKKGGGGEREREREGRRGGAWRGWVMVMEERESSRFYGYGERGERSFKLLWLWGERREKPQASMAMEREEREASSFYGYGGRGLFF